VPLSLRVYLSSRSDLEFAYLHICTSAHLSYFVPNQSKFMKRVLWIVLLTVIGTTAFAQKNTIVGKWKVAAINAEGLNLNLEDRESMKKMLIEQVEKETGEKPDSASIEAGLNMMISMFETMSLEFAKDGKSKFSMIDPEGSDMKVETGTYTVDYAAGLIRTITSDEDGKEKKEEMKMKFEGDYLVLTKVDKKETIRLKRND
jgi:hypothetical protein